jgi:hypothetical protein
MSYPIMVLYNLINSHIDFTSPKTCYGYRSIETNGAGDAGGFSFTNYGQVEPRSWRLTDRGICHTLPSMKSGRGTLGVGLHLPCTTSYLAEHLVTGKGGQKLKPWKTVGTC